jgi:hypothetical protein
MLYSCFDVSEQTVLELFLNLPYSLIYHNLLVPMKIVLINSSSLPKTLILSTKVKFHAFSDLGTVKR